MLAVLTALLVPSAIAACGARTGLDVGDPPPFDLDPDAGPDAPPDVVVVNDCVDAGTTYIYVITTESELYSFYPPTASFHAIGTIACPNAMGAPFSMGVDRNGTAYVVFTPSGQLYEVSTATAACKATSFTPGQHGFTTFGMGFSTDKQGPTEKLYAAESDFNTSSAGLASIDTGAFKLNFIAPFSKDLGIAVELTGTGDGRLFGFFINPNSSTSDIAEIDKTNGKILSDSPVKLGTINDFAFAFWGGDFYLFHSDGGPGGTTVTRYDPSNTSVKDVATLGTHVVGVGVSTCAPE